VAETVFRAYLGYHCSVATQTSHVALNAKAPEPAQVWSKSVSNEGHFTLLSQTVFRPYLDNHGIGANQTSLVALSTGDLQTVQVWYKSVRKEGYLTLVAGTPSRHHLDFHCIVATKNVTRGTPSTRTRTTAYLVEIGR
jgi:hypothetical protein